MCIEHYLKIHRKNEKNILTFLKYPSAGTSQPADKTMTPQCGKHLQTVSCKATPPHHALHFTYDFFRLDLTSTPSTDLTLHDVIPHSNDFSLHFLLHVLIDKLTQEVCKLFVGEQISHTSCGTIKLRTFHILRDADPNLKNQL